jgi:hypothetical protein
MKCNADGLLALLSRTIALLPLVVIVFVSAKVARADGFFDSEEALQVGAFLDANRCAGPRCTLSLHGSDIKVNIVKLDLSERMQTCEVEKTGTCGSAGCGKAILGKVDGKWRILLESRNFKYMTTSSNGFRDVAITMRDFSQNGPPREVAQVYVWSGIRYEPRK